LSLDARGDELMMMDAIEIEFGLLGKNSMLFDHFRLTSHD